jgi:hypothetical protein
MIVLKRELGVPTDHAGNVHGSSLRASRNHTSYTPSQTDGTHGTGVDVASLDRFQILFERLEQLYFIFELCVAASIRRRIITNDAHIPTRTHLMAYNATGCTGKHVE